MPLQCRQQHRDDRLQPLRAEPVRGLPLRDQRLLHLGSVSSTDPPLDRRAIADLRPQQADCVFPVIARDRDKLIQNLAPLRPSTGSVPIRNSRHQLGFCGHADPPHPLLPSSSPVGSIAGEATILAGNIHAEAMRSPVLSVARQLGHSRSLTRYQHICSGLDCRRQGREYALQHSPY